VAARGARAAYAGRWVSQRLLHDPFAQHILAAFHRGLKEIGYFEGVSDFAAVCPRQLAVQSASAARQPFGTA
jgi:hypothetical protein